MESYSCRSCTTSYFTTHITLKKKKARVQQLLLDIDTIAFEK